MIEDLNKLINLVNEKTIEIFKLCLIQGEMHESLKKIVSINEQRITNIENILDNISKL